jgi:hypothetical protein
MNKTIGTFTVEVEQQDNGLFDVYIAEEDGSGVHYRDLTIEIIGEYVKDMIEDYAQN